MCCVSDRFDCGHCFPLTALLVIDSDTTGHSMGAGVAVLLTSMLRNTPMLMSHAALTPHAAALPTEQLSAARCYAFACPAMLTPELAHNCKGFVTSVLHGTDLVPTFSAASVDMLREEVRTSSWSQQMSRDIRVRATRAGLGPGPVPRETDRRLQG